MYKKILKAIKQYDTIVIARHIGVDPDALCSQLALRDVIKLNFPDVMTSSWGFKLFFLFLNLVTFC